MTMRLGALALLVVLAGCGSCNCAVPAYNAGGAGSAVILGGVALPPGAVPPAPLPPPATLACSQGAGSIPLGPALSPFALLAGTTITNTGASIVTYAAGATTGGIDDDRIGVSPGTSVVGFYPSGTDTDGPSAIYAVGYNNTPAVTVAAEAALTTAYNVAAGTPSTTTFPGGQDLALAHVGVYPVGTLPAGVYNSPSTMGIMAGNLTLDGGGNPQSVFIFQVGTALTTTLNGGATGNVTLTNGASACNIYWQIGTSATLGGASFFGNVLAAASVTLTSSTQFTGRALARSGAVTISTATLVTDPGGT
jgi:hypothetical protein